MQLRERVWAGVCLPPLCQVCLYHHISSTISTAAVVSSTSFSCSLVVHFFLTINLYLALHPIHYASTIIIRAFMLGNHKSRVLDYLSTFPIIFLCAGSLFVNIFSNVTYVAFRVLTLLCSIPSNAIEVVRHLRSS